MNQRISQSLARRRTAALLASAMAVGALTIVITNGITSDGIQGTGHNTISAAGVTPADNGVLTGDEAVTPADNGILTGDDAVTPADNGVITGDEAVTPDENGVITGDDAVSPDDNGIIMAD